MNHYETIIYSLKNRVATITFNRPEYHNALNPQMRSEFADAFQNALQDDEVRVIVLTGAGRSFGAGQDLSVKSDIEKGAVHLLDVELKPVLKAIHESEKPVISAINGNCVGVSIGYALACDLSIMAEDASLFIAFAGNGLIPDGGVGWHLVNKLGYSKAYQLVVEAEKLSADQCIDWGLVNKKVPADALQSEAQSWAEKLAKGSPLAQRFSKTALRESMQTNLTGAISVEAHLQHHCLISEDFEEAVNAFYEKRTPEFKGY